MHNQMHFYRFYIQSHRKTGKSSCHVYMGINWHTLEITLKDAYLQNSCFSSSEAHRLIFVSHLSGSSNLMLCSHNGLNIYLCVCVISTIVRIQFRLPDGSSFTNQFPLQGRLQEVRQFVVQVCFHDCSHTTPLTSLVIVISYNIVRNMAAF